jgi:hypothetical protein
MPPKAKAWVAIEEMGKATPVAVALYNDLPTVFDSLHSAYHNSILRYDFVIP